MRSRSRSAARAPGASETAPAAARVRRSWRRWRGDMGRTPVRRGLSRLAAVRRTARFCEPRLNESLLLPRLQIPVEELLDPLLTLRVAELRPAVAHALDLDE